MSLKEQARRTKAEIMFGGTDITSSMEPYLLSLTYTDNEEDESDDLQIKLQDRSTIWMTKWLNDMIQVSATPEKEDTESESSNTQSGAGSYTVTARSGLNVRSGPGTENSKLGLLSYGQAVTVKEIQSGWAKIDYNGAEAYVSASYISKSSANSSAASTAISGAQVVSAMYTAYYPSDDPIEGGFLDAQDRELKPWENTMAAPEEIAFGTKITIQGTGTSRDGQTYTVRDRGTAITIKNGVYHFDILMSTNEECNAWGVRYGSAVIGGTTAAASTDTATAESEETAKVYGSLRLQAVLVRENWAGDGKDTLLDCGQFEIDSVEVSGPPSTVTIKATSLPYRATIRKATRSKVWENYTLSGIAREIASANGMICMFESDSDPEYERTEQCDSSDIDFLSGLCHDAGISLKATNNILVLFNQANYESKPAVSTIKRGDGSYTKYKLSAGKAGTDYAACRVSYTDPASKQCFEGIAYAEDFNAEADGNQQLEVKLKVKSDAEAEALAEKQLRLHNKHERTAVFTMVGNPELVAGVNVQLSGWGSWDGKYIINQAKHSIGGSGYTTQITLRRVLAEGYSITMLPKVESESSATSSTISSSSTGSSTYREIGAIKIGAITIKLNQSSSVDRGAAAFVAVAISQLGYREGYNNYSKYGEYFGDPNAQWCVYFVSWCADRSGAPIPHYGYVGDVSDYFKARGKYKSVSSGYIPKAGDLMIQGTKHIGIVESATRASVHTIEGNCSDKVKRMTRTYGEITGFCTPWG